MKGSEMIFLLVAIVLAPHCPVRIANATAIFLALFGFVIWAGE